MGCGIIVGQQVWVVNIMNLGPPIKDIKNRTLWRKYIFSIIYYSERGREDIVLISWVPYVRPWGCSLGSYRLSVHMCGRQNIRMSLKKRLVRFA